MFFPLRSLSHFQRQQSRHPKTLSLKSFKSPLESPETNWSTQPATGHQKTGPPRRIYCHVPQATQDAAADHAHNNLRGYSYNLNFAFNKSKNPWMLNCSQLVWYAYKYGAGVDIDSNGGPGVYPHDIVEGPLAHTYANL